MLRVTSGTVPDLEEFPFSHGDKAHRKSGHGAQKRTEDAQVDSGSVSKVCGARADQFLLFSGKAYFIKRSLIIITSNFYHIF